MGRDTELDPKLLAETRTVIARLELVSHGTTLNWDSTGGVSAEGPLIPPTGHRPAPRSPGGRMPGDREPEFLGLRRRLARCDVDADVRAVKVDADHELEMALRQPPPPGDPEPWTLHWKREIANSPQTVTELARLHGISRPTIYKFIREHREAA